MWCVCGVMLCVHTRTLLKVTYTVRGIKKLSSTGAGTDTGTIDNT